MCGEIMLLC